VASPLIWKVYDKSGQHVASCRDAMGTVYALGAIPWGAKIKVSGKIVWTDDQDGRAQLQTTGDVERRIAEVVKAMEAREWGNRKAAYDAAHGAGAAARVLEERARG
jgi:hypothetical protein